MQLQYSVAAVFLSTSDMNEYVEWLVDDHADKVLRAGALDAKIVLPDSDDGTLMVRCEYTFESREAFDDYVRVKAPGLRQEGLRKFPATKGIVFSRETAVVRIKMDGRRRS